MPDFSSWRFAFQLPMTFCLAFLQNMWVRDPERTKAVIAKYGEEYRRRYLRFALFAGCKTGRMIERAFGDLVAQIEFEETTREIAGNPKTIFPADLNHIKTALEQHKPQVVIAFGRIAQEAVGPLWTGKFITAHHPAARHPSSYETLIQAAKKLSLFASSIETSKMDMDNKTHRTSMTSNNGKRT